MTKFQRMKCAIACLLLATSAYPQTALRRFTEADAVTLKPPGPALASFFLLCVYRSTEFSPRHLAAIPLGPKPSLGQLLNRLVSKLHTKTHGLSAPYSCWAASLMKARAVRIGSYRQPADAARSTLCRHGAKHYSNFNGWRPSLPGKVHLHNNLGRTTTGHWDG